MGPCVVKRTDIDPDSDGEDETKAAYYADKGKKRPMKKAKKASTTKKRKRNNENNGIEANGHGNDHKRQRLDVAMHSMPPSLDGFNANEQGQQSYYYPPPMNNGHGNGQFDGYYHQNGYMHSVNNNDNYPPPPMAEANEDCLPPEICHDDIPPPPALEALDDVPPRIEDKKEEIVVIEHIEIGEVKDVNEGKKNGNNVENDIDGMNVTNGGESKENAADIVTNLNETTLNEVVVVVEESGQQIDDNVECINEETEDEDEDLGMDLKLPSTSPAPKKIENEDDDLALTVPE